MNSSRPGARGSEIGAVGTALRPAAAICVALAFMLALALAPPTRADIKEFPVPNLVAEFNDIVAGPDGRVWFTEPSANKIGRITTAGQITEFNVPTAGARPYAIAAGPDGNLWFTEAGAAKIGRITPTGAITEFAVPGPAGDIVAGSDGALWYTRGAKIGRITTGGSATEFDVPISAGEIVSGPDGALWFNDFNAGRIGRLTTAGSYSPVTLPAPDPSLGPAGPLRLAAGPDGAVWYTLADFLQIREVAVGRVTPGGSGSIFKRVAGLPLPEGITGGPDSAVWFTELPCCVNGNTGRLTKIVRITPSGSIAEYLPDQVGGAAAITSGPGNALWFTGVGKVGRITADTPAGPILDPLYPAANATGAAPDTTVVAPFNKPMDKPATQAAFSLRRTSDGAPVAGSFGWYGNTLIFKPSANLAPGTQYTVSVGSGARGATGVGLQNPTSWKFSTAGGPAVVWFTPDDGSAGLRPNEPVAVIFDKPMNRAATQAAFTLKRTSDGTAVAGTFSWAFNDIAMTFTPNSLLAPGTQYTASITSAARDASGKPLANPTTWRFTTTVRPIVAFVSPADGSAGVSTDTVVVAAFNKPMDHASAQAAFSLVRASDGAPVGGSFGWYGNALIFKPSAPLAPGTEYRARVEDTAEDTAGNRLAIPEPWSFTTSAGGASDGRASARDSTPAV